MARLYIHLLGPFQVTKDNEPVTSFGSDKERALLTYLAAEVEQPHRREKLAGLLWPDWPERSARSNLRSALANVRSAIGDRGADPPFLNISRQTLQFNSASDAWIDVVAFTALLAGKVGVHQSIQALEDAAELYRGSFLEGFSLPDSAAFEEWLFFTREQLHRKAAEGLQRLTAHLEERGDLERALQYAWRQAELDPWREEAHQQVMRLLARSGQRAAALAQYEACRQVLANELGVEPSAETQTLYQHIQAGELAFQKPAVRTVRGYELQERVGSGGFGVVYRAFQPAVGRAVAIKVILPQFATHPDFVRHFETDAHLVARLEHPHIVPLYDYWREADGAYLVMRWLRGGDLHQSLQRGPWSPQAAAELLDQIASALAVAHGQEVVHRDVKPENILLDEHGNAYLTDFGIAKDVVQSARATEPGVVRGSLWYISPEQAQSQSVTPQSDLYSLGVVMYEVLSGEHPFAGLAAGDQLIRRLTEPLPPLRERRPTLPAELEEVVQRATAGEPAQRYPGVMAFATAFRAAVSGAAAVKAPPRAPDRAELKREIAAPAPAFLEEEAEPVETLRPAFVARERELQRLDGYLNEALQGEGRVVFVTGGAGRGKTTLMEEFARRAMESYPDLLVAAGNCNAYSGVGDPYLPFREVMGMLTGDVEARWAAGSITREHTRRLWAAFPHAIETLANHGPLLIDSFLPSAALLTRAEAAAPDGAPWLERLRERNKRQQVDARGLEQSHLFGQITRSLRELAQTHPLMLILDDMQWADSASISLLFHLGRRLEGSRILILSAYRPDEVALGRDGQPHPLDKVLAELKRTFGDVWVDLAQIDETEGRRFVDAFLDTEPHRLGEDFRRALARHTGGHPLFTIELWRAMQERGDLVQDEDGRWVEASVLDWQTLPARVEGVIENRVGQLKTELREVLAVASVEGEMFTAQVVARVQGISERQLLQALSQQLERRHRLVQDRGEIQIGHHRLSRYQFGHTLFQRYLYNGLGAGERRLLHREIAQVLEELYAGRTEEIAVPLVRHFELAGVPEQAVDYLLQAGDQARALYAHAEAEGYYLQAVGYLRRSGQDESAARTLMKLGLVYTAAFEPQKAQEAYDEAFALWEPLRRPTDLPEMRAATAVLRLAVEEPLTLDPGRITDDLSRFMAVQLFEGLVRVGRDYNVLPAAAARWEVADDGKRYIFHLREDVSWNDGAPLKAADFEYAWKRNLDPSSGSSQAHLLYAIKNARAFREGKIDRPGPVGVVAVDDQTLEVHLEAPTAYLPHLLAHPVTYPLPRGVVERHGQAWAEAGNLVSNGPYELVALEREERMVLRRNPFYRGPFPGNVERVECSIFAGYGTALEAYAANEVDAVSMITADPHTIARARAAFGDELVVIPQPSLLYLIFRADRPPFDDVRVRRAFVHAVDRAALLAQAFGDRRLPATGGFVPPGMPGHSPDIGLAYDPEGARRLMAQAGFPDGRGFPAVSWVHKAAGTDQRCISFLRASWRQNLGLDLASQSLEMRDLLEKLARDMAHLTVIGWSAGFPDPDNMLRVTFHSKEGVSNPRWHNARFDQLVEQAGRVTDHARRMALYREADRILVAEEAVIMPLTYGRGRMLVKPWVTLPRSLSVSVPLKSVVVERRAY